MQFFITSCYCIYMYTIVVNHCFLVQDLNFLDFIVNISCLQAQQLSNNEQNGTISYDASVEIEVDSTYNADQQIGNESTLTFLLLTLGYCACAVRVTVVVLCVCVCCVSATF